MLRIVSEKSMKVSPGEVLVCVESDSSAELDAKEARDMAGHEASRLGLSGAGISSWDGPYQVDESGEPADTTEKIAKLNLQQKIHGTKPRYHNVFTLSRPAFG